MKKCMPSFNDELLSQIPLVYQIDPTESISQSEFEMMFDPRMQNKVNSMPRPSALKIKHQ